MTVGELLVKLGIDTTAYKQGLAQVEKQTRTTGTRLGDIFKNAFSVAIGIGFFEAIRRGFRSVVGEAVSFNAMMEQARIGFTTMLGSAEKAQAFLDEMAEFAARTPFEFPDLLEASRRMMAMGFAAEEVLPTMKAIGDATAGLGLGREGINRIILALGQMRAKSKVSGEEMRQLTEAGIPAWEMLAEAMGKSTAEVMKMSEKGLIPANKAIKILTEGMEKRFPNMMENMENTWQGVTSTIKDVWRMTIGAITQNLFAGVTDWLRGIRDTATSFYDFFSTLRKRGVDITTALRLAIAKTFGPDAAATVSVFTDAIRTAWMIAVKAAVAIKTYWALIKPVVIGAAIAFFAFKVVIPIMAGVRTAIMSTWAALGPLGWAILGVSAAVAAGVSLWSKYAASIEQANLQKALQAINEQNDGVSDSSQQAAQGMEEQADATKKAGKAAAKNIQSFDEVHQLMEDTAGAAEDITTGLDEMAIPELEAPGGLGVPELNLEEMLEQAKPTLAGFLEWIKQGAGNLWESVKQKWSNFKEWVKSWAVWDWLGEKWSSLKTWAGNLWGVVKEKWGNFKEWVVSWAGPLWEGIKEAWSTFIDWATDLWEGVKIAWSTFIGWLSEKWDWIGGIAEEAWNWIKEHIITPIQEAWDWLVEAWGTIGDWLSEKWDWIGGIAEEAWNWIKEHIITPIQEAWDWLVEAWGTIGSWLSDKWDWIKDIAETTWGWIKKHIVTPVQEAWDWLETTWNEIAGFLEDTWDGIKKTAEDIWDGIAKAIKSPINIIIKAFNWMIDQLNKIHFTIPSWVSYIFPGLGGKSWGFDLERLDLLPMAEGGIVTQPTTALIGERGPEAVIPLTRSAFAEEMASVVASAVYTAIRDAFRVVYAEQGATQREIVLEIDGKRIARAIVPSLISEGQRTGTFVTVRGGLY